MSTKSVGNGKDIVLRGFHFADCDLCGKATWHYKSADNAPASCTNHSNWQAGKRHVVVSGSTAVIGNFRPQHEAPSERELRIVNRLDRSLWRNAEEQRRIGVELTDPAAQHIFSEKEKSSMKDPNKLYCSFCDNEIHSQMELTVGKEKPVISKKVDAYRDSAGDVHIHERVTVRAETVRACPNCVVNIRKPVVVRRV